MSKLDEVENYKLRYEENSETFSEDENIDEDNMYNENYNRTHAYVPGQNNFESNFQTYEKALASHEELEKLENMSFEFETRENSSEDVSFGPESVYSEIVSSTSQSIKKEMINDDIIVLEPNNPILARIQNKLKQHLLKQKDSIKQELFSLEEVIKKKRSEQNEESLSKSALDNRVIAQTKLLSNFREKKIELKNTNELVKTSINHGKKRNTEILMKISIETKKLSDVKRQLDCSRGLLNELKKHEKEQTTTFHMYNQKKSQTQQYKKKLLNDQQKQDILLLSLTQEILRLEDRMKQLGEQAEAKYNERELLKQKVMDISTDLDAINGDNTKITLLWNDVLISIQQQDKSFQKIQNDLQEARDNYDSLIKESNNYKKKTKDLKDINNKLNNSLKKLKREHNNLQNSLKSLNDQLDSLNDTFSELLQMTEFQHQNLNQVIIDQKSLKNEINSLSIVVDDKTNQKLRYEEDILDELKKQSFSNDDCVRLNHKISKLKAENKNHELAYVEIEENLNQALLKLAQYRLKKSNLEKEIEENMKSLNNRELALSALDSELKKLFIDIQNRSEQTNFEKKQLETLKKRCQEGSMITPQMKIQQVQRVIDEVGKEIHIVKQAWVLNQKKNVQLLNKRNNQYNELNLIRKVVSAMDTKNLKLEQDIESFTKEVDHYNRQLTNMRYTMLKLNEKFNQNKGEKSQLLNENEWIQWTYLAELKESEKQILEYMDRLILLKNEVIDLKNMYIEKQRNSKSWETKIQLLIEMKKEMKNKDGDFGDIDAIKRENHKIQMREIQLKKISEKLMVDLEACLSRREKIYNKVAVKETRLKQKKEVKQKFSKDINNLRNNIKKIEMECKKSDRNISDLLNNKIELECKLTYLIDQLVLVQTNIDDIIRQIEDLRIRKIENIHCLSYKQNHAKFLEEVKNGKYRPLIKNESKINEEYEAEGKKNSDLISVIEILKIDFPHLDFQVAHSMLKSVDE